MRLLLLVLCGGLVACAAEDDGGVCDASVTGTPSVHVAERNADAFLPDAGTLSVFVPPQGGIATELDVQIEGVALEAVQTLRFQVAASDGSALAIEQYFGEGLPFVCTMSDGLQIRDVPVAFNDGVQLEDLDGSPVQVETTVTLTDGDPLMTSARVDLVATEY
ncbi:MAG: hypothetical protein AAGA54_18995 [Myxococcota bacterium]